ncbi:MAG: 4-hydroxy-3-methylbut-2-enyl diphosphate reductase [Candidatus Adiutrix sp.]|jgi:4-hydroxy-3-methylbut-2-enyl diphosphate reductase|nr:4-hydroxy-3-methylbut-2-enyl diphosphate reductase [Candidatus Adiutrix sp.]
MEIKLAETLGYCPGVKRALDTAFKLLARRGGDVFSHGELLHNPPTLELLARKGLKPWRGESRGTVIIRAHGLPPSEIAALKALGLTVSDATCPRVRLVQTLAAKEAGQGRLVIIWGQADHPEVIGLLGHAGDRGRVISGPGEVAGLPEAEAVLLVAQTTQNQDLWPEVAAAVRARWPEALVKDTICEATATRQNQVRKLVERAEALVVVGGRTSGNTRRLAELGQAAGRRTFLTETGADLKPEDFQNISSVAVAAGASASNWQIALVLQTLKAMDRGHSGKFWPRLLRALVLSSLFAALGLAGLALGTGRLLGAEPPFTIFSFFFFLTIALHLTRDLLQSRGQTPRLAGPDRTAFFAKYRRSLRWCAAGSFILCFLAAGLTTGDSLKAPAGLLRAMAFSGLNLVALAGGLAALAHHYVPRPEKPALTRALGKPALLGLGWAGAILWAARPGWDGLRTTLHTAPGPALFAGGLIFAHLFIVAVFSDILGVRGDRIFGRPTLPSSLGAQALRRLLYSFLAAWALGLALAAAWGLVSSALAFFMAVVGPLYNLPLVRLLGQEPGRKPAADLDPPDYCLEALLFGQLPAAGIALWLGA